MSYQTGQGEYLRRNSKKTLNSLPLELLGRIFRYLNKKDLISLLYVSKKLSQAARQKLYRSIIFVAGQEEPHLIVWKSFCNERSLNDTFLSSLASFELLVNSLEHLNADNAKFVREFRCIASPESNTVLLENNITKLLSLNITPSVLVIPIFRREHLGFDTSRLRRLSLAETLNSNYGFCTKVPVGAPKMKVVKLEGLHLRSCNEPFFTNILQDISGLESVSHLKFTGNCMDDDYAQYPNQQEEMANIFILNYEISQLNQGKGFTFPKLQHLTLHKYLFENATFRKWSTMTGFYDISKLKSLSLLDCNSNHELRPLVSEYFAKADYQGLEQLVYEHSSILNHDTISQMTNLKRLHVSKGGFPSDELTTMIAGLPNLEKFSLNDSKLIRDFHRTFNKHRESNVLFSRRFLKEYQFQPTQPILKYTEEQLSRLLNCYRITTDYFAANYNNDIDPFYEIYFNHTSMISIFLKETFRPFKEEIDLKIKPVAEDIFSANENLKYVKICGMGFSRDEQGQCRLDA